MVFVCFLYIYIYTHNYTYTYAPDVLDRKGNPAGLSETPTSGSMSLTFCVDHAEPPRLKAILPTF